MSATTRRAIPAILLLAGLLAAGQALAESRTITGTQLVLSTSLSDGVAIATDASLHGQLRVSMDGDLSCLSVVAADTTAVIATSRCGSDTGRLRIDVAPDMPVTVSSSGDGDIQIADLRGQLVASLSGSGDLVAGRTGGLVLSIRSSGDAAVGEVDGPATIDINGEGDARIKEVRGPLTIKQVGSGDVVVGSIQAAAVVVESNGSGDILLGSGQIENLRARLNGSGDLSIGATTRNGDVDAHGGGDVKLGPVTGALSHNASGDSEVVVLDAAHARAIDDQVARKLGHRSSGSGTSISIHTPSVVKNLLTAAFVALVLYICWRIVRGAGGLPGMRRQFGRGAPAAPSNPAVLALGETMARLEQRLGRLESYVTTREFDLARKFRELGPS